MAPANEQHPPGRILSHGVKSALEGSGIGRVGLRMGRSIRSSLQRLGDPFQRKVWLRRIGLPLRNAILLNRPITVSMDGTCVSLVPRGSTASDIWVGLRRESHEIASVLKLLEPGMIVFDVGAGAGLFSIGAAKEIGARRVFAFEPRSSSRDLLRKNLALNRVADVNIFQAALGGSVDEGILRIDIFMRNHNIPRVDVMKVDIEGGELMLFRGARELLARPDAPVILYEGFGFLTRGFDYHPVEILWFLESCGYSLFLLNSETGKISELKPDYQYDSMVLAAKPGHPAHSHLREKLM